ncbi:alpha/beta fold hydrolase [Bacillus sp. NTK074B]|uniref:alpha/beta fold hydrolase n=1 Tax=Bacillus sp. NTK074B TaxID=2802174 RepID=UPI001A8F7E89|nr:alpha/beta fold hydrolase [Bacillus sp. NTK074B]
MICLHGLGNTSLSFIEIAEELKEEFEIISIDLPGHGKSDKFETDAEYEMENITTWLYEILMKMNVGRFYFLAHSYGAYSTPFHEKVWRCCHQNVAARWRLYDEGSFLSNSR